MVVGAAMFVKVIGMELMLTSNSGFGTAPLVPCLFPGDSF
jgi:hypothetical protein